MTGLIAFESVIRDLIGMGVEPRYEDWTELLDICETPHLFHRSWTQDYERELAGQSSPNEKRVRHWSSKVNICRGLATTATAYAVTAATARSIFRFGMLVFLVDPGSAGVDPHHGVRDVPGQVRIAAVGQRRVHRLGEPGGGRCHPLSGLGELLDR
jgi:hypothetical protein